MADEGTRGQAGRPEEEIHDDDELAAALAAELERIAPTGAVPVFRASAVPFGPVVADVAAVAARATPARPAPGAAGAPSAPAPARAAPAVAAHSGATERPEALAPRPARGSSPPPPASAELSPAPPGHPVLEHHRHAETARHGARSAERPGRDEPAADVPSRHARPLSPVSVGRGAADRQSEGPIADGLGTGDVIRRAGLPQAATVQADPDPDPVTDAPALAPLSTSVGLRKPRVRSDPPSSVPITDTPPLRPLRSDLPDPLHETGSLALPPPLYESWERSLRAIGRPRVDEDPDMDVAEHADEDAPTAALARSSLGPLPDRRPEAAPPDATAEPAPRQRRGRRRAQQAQPPQTTPEPGPTGSSGTLPAGDDEGRDDEGLDEQDSGIRAVAAADNAAVPLPLLVEPASPAPDPVSGSGAAQDGRSPLPAPGLAAVLLLWCGGFVSPVLMLAGFGLAAAGGGAAAAGAMVLGGVVAVPAAARLTAAAAADRVGVPALAARVFGRGGGIAATVVLLAVRLFAAALALLTAGELAAALADRSGVAGGATGSAAVTAMVFGGLAAVVATGLPRRIARAVLLVLAAAALLVTGLVLVVTAPSAMVSVTAAPRPGAVVVAGATGFAVLGLLLAVTAADVTGMVTSRRRGRGAGLGVALSALAGLVVLVLALAIGRGAGATDAVPSFARLVHSAVPPGATGALTVLLLVAALPLPALMIGTAGQSGAVLLGAARSSRLGAVAAGLLALAVALVLHLDGMDAPTALVRIGPMLGVPAAVWAGVMTLAPLRRPAGGSSSVALFASAVVATVIGWLLVDGLLVAAERSPVLELLGVSPDATWRASPALGLLVAFVLGLAAAGIGRIAARRVGRRRRGRPGHQPVGSVAA